MTLQQNPFYAQMMQSLAQPMPQPMPQPINPLAPVTQTQTDYIEVSGKAGAEAFQMMPNSRALLLDNTAPILWVAKTDGAGYKTLAAFDLVPHEEAKQEDAIKSLEDRIRKIEERLNNGKSNHTDAAGNKQQHKPEQ